MHCTYRCRILCMVNFILNSNRFSHKRIIADSQIKNAFSQIKNFREDYYYNLIQRK